MENIIIRAAEEKDLLKCEELLNSEEFKTANGTNWPVRWLRQYLDENFFLVAEYDNNVIGCILGEKLKQRGSIIWLLVVDLKYRNMGVGTKLIESYEHNARQTECKWTIVYSDLHNPKTLNFYKKNDYVAGDNFTECLKVLQKKSS